MKRTPIGRAAVVAALSAVVLAVSQAPASAAPSGWHQLDNFQTGQHTFLTDGGGKTLSSIDALDPKDRIEEIARMLGGLEITATTRKHARELLAS